MVWGFIAAVVGTVLAIIYREATRDEECAMPGISKFYAERIPIYLMPSHLFSAQVRQAIERAAIFWNDALKHEAFTMRLVDGGSTVVVDLYAGNESRRRKNKVLAYVTPYLDEELKGIKSAAVRINTNLIDQSVFELDVLTHAIAHELGHVLGLRHDSDPGSLMYPKVKGLATRPYITQNDTKFIRGAYDLAKA